MRGRGAASWFEPPRGARRLAVGFAKVRFPARPCRGRGEDRQGPLFLIIAAVRAQGRLGQLSARSVLNQKDALCRCLRPCNLLSRVAVDAKHAIARIWWATKIWIDVLPNHGAVGCDFEEPAEQALIDGVFPFGRR